jgi:hypothetical protein
MVTSLCSALFMVDISVLCSVHGGISVLYSVHGDISVLSNHVIVFKVQTQVWLTAMVCHMCGGQGGQGVCGGQGVYGGQGVCGSGGVCGVVAKVCVVCVYVVMCVVTEMCIPTLGETDQKHPVQW